MERLGFIHEKLDIKILILFILRRLPGIVAPIDLQDFTQQCDEGFGYFEYSDCLAELIESGLVIEERPACASASAAPMPPKRWRAACLFPFARGQRR